LEELEERADCEAVLQLVAHFGARVDRVVVPAADSASFDVARFGQIGDDPLGGAFCDSDLVGDVSESCVRIVGDAEQNLRVAGYERPGLAINT
jgi:hypothetical protein